MDPGPLRRLGIALNTLFHTPICLREQGKNVELFLEFIYSALLQILSDYANL